MKFIVTHNGVFHADDVFATAVLKLCIAREAEVIRSRDIGQIGTTDLFILDVGGVYDEAHNSFDHHQPGGAGVRPNGVPYATFGLVWKTFGMTCCGHNEEVWRMIEESLVQAVDAADCGYGDLPKFGISRVISGFNPSFPGADALDFDVQFMKAVKLAMEIINNELSRALFEVKAKMEVRQFIKNSNGNKVIIMDRFLPWLEVVVNEAPSAEFVVFPSETGDWRIQTIPVEVGSFLSRKLLPESWAGLRDEDLAQKTGVEGAIFCHIGRFIGGARTEEGVLEMAEQAIRQ